MSRVQLQLKPLLWIRFRSKFTNKAKLKAQELKSDLNNATEIEISTNYPQNYRDSNSNRNPWLLSKDEEHEADGEADELEDRPKWPLLILNPEE